VSRTRRIRLISFVYGNVACHRVPFAHAIGMRVGRRERQLRCTQDVWQATHPVMDLICIVFSASCHRLSLSYLHQSPSVATFIPFLLTSSLYHKVSFPVAVGAFPSKLWRKVFYRQKVLFPKVVSLSFVAGGFLPDGGRMFPS